MSKRGNIYVTPREAGRETTTMLNPWKASLDHEALFIERYDKLLVWALALTENDEQLAEDLVHDAFIQFTFNQPDLAGIQSIEGYLYGILRRLHLSHIRRAAQRHLQQFSIIDCDSAESSLRTIDPRDQIQVQDELRRVCQYACWRKESAKAASVLILRFFHGYYPSEIALLLRNSIQTVNVWLRTARGEARLNLENPQALGFINKNANVTTLPAAFARPADDLLNELRQMIFAQRQGECFTKEQLQAVCREDNSSALSCKELAHLVSCETCLTTVNNLLALPQLSERYPADAAGKEGRKKKGGPGGGGGPRGGPGGGRGGGVTGQTTTKCRRRARDVFEHYPQELCVSVNGYIQGSQRISSAISELTLTVDQNEPISFVEVFGGHQTRLLLMSVDELPPEGPIQQTAKIELSEERTIEVRLKFSSPWPTLEMTYNDPTFVSDQVAKDVESEITQVANLDSLPQPRESIADQESLAPPRRPLGFKWPRLIWSLFLKPGVVTALVAVILIASLLLLWRSPSSPPLTAASVLRQAQVAEETLAARTDQVLHRTLTVEEKSSTGALISQQRVETWHSGEKGITASRLYDQQGALVAGDWRRADGVQTLYHHGSHPQLQLAPKDTQAKRDASALNFDNPWQFSPSAREFSSLIAADSMRLEEQPSAYVLRYDRQATDTVQGLLSATLVLSRVDIHAREQTLKIRRGSEVREYRFVETSFEQRPTTAVAPSVFEPDPVLLSSSKPLTPNSKLESTAVAPLAVAPLPVVATPEQEVEVLNLLNQAKADLGEQVSVVRTPDGQLRVQGIVETDDRKRELVQALRPVMSNSAVKVDIQTVSEAAKRQPARSASESIVVQGVQAASNALPVEAELRRYFSKNPRQSGDQIDDEVHRFAGNTLRRSFRAVQHAWALKRLAERFSADDLRSLTPEARAKWLSMMSGHAAAIRLELGALGQELGPVFGQSFPSGSAEVDIKSDQDLVTAVQRLAQLASACDRDIQSSFTVSTSPGSSAGVKSEQFRRSLRGAEELANKISDHR